MVWLELNFAHNYRILRTRHSILSLRHQFDFLWYNWQEDSIFTLVCSFVDRGRRQNTLRTTRDPKMALIPLASELLHADPLCNIFTPILIYNQTYAREMASTCWFCDEKAIRNLPNGVPCWAKQPLSACVYILRGHRQLPLTQCIRITDYIFPK